MEALSDKQQRRLERKKKKLMALANLIQINDKEQHQNKIITNNVDVDVNVTSENNHPHEEPSVNGNNIKVTTKNHKSGRCAVKGNSDDNIEKPYKTNDAEEPLPKKLKVNGDSCVAITNTILSDPEYMDIKKQLKERQRVLAKETKIKLKEPGQKALVSVMDDERTPLFLTDIQHLIMWSQLGKRSPCTPERWCQLDSMRNIHHTVILTLEGLSLFHFLQNEKQFKMISRLFDNVFEVIMPPKKDCGIMEELAKVPLTCLQAEKLIIEHGSLEAAIEMNKDPTLLINTIFPIANVSVTSEANNLHPNDKFPRTKLLLSALQMVDEGYPMPLKGELNKHFANYIFTKDQYDPVTNRSPMFGVDCEMCKTSLGYSELTRISIVNEQFETVYETLVRPANKIVDYLTPYSGITPEIMKAVTKTLHEVQDEIKKLLPGDAILVGQSLNCDLNAMRMMHPYVIDTSVCFNITGLRRRKSKLRDLVLKYLQETIQKQSGGHDSVEDSISSLKLVKMKLANNVEFGDEVLIQKKRLHDIIQAAQGNAITNNLFGHLTKTEKRTALITAKPLTESLCKLLNFNEMNDDTSISRCIRHILMSNNKEVMRKMGKVLSKNALTLAEINLTTEQLLPASVYSTLDDIHKWINNSWQVLPQNTLFIVLLGNAAECSSGVAMLAIKRSLNNDDTITTIKNGNGNCTDFPKEDIDLNGRGDNKLC